MDASVIVPVILAGGSGTRLWPLSRSLYPKQLLPLVNERTLLQNTVARLAGVVGVSAPLVVSNSEHRFMVAEQLREADSNAAILLEPVGRNTAPAVAIAALEALAQEDDPVLLVLPADHLIDDEVAFKEAVAGGLVVAETGDFITFGILPHHPEIGYGYICKGDQVAAAADVYRVARFVEKPDLATAERYLESGEYLWNSGMFMFKARRYLEELEKFAPEMLALCCEAYDGKVSDIDFIRLDEAAFAKCPSDSIDYAVMEKTDAACVIPLDCGWSDIGSWAALWERGEQDENGNVFKGDVIGEDVQDCYIHASGRMVAAVGLREHVVVETADAVLVAAKDRVQDVKAIVERLKLEQRQEVVLHRQVFRPWGSYECIDNAERFQVKRIVVSPGARLSLQAHHHRAEHWIVVKGTAKVVNGDQEIILAENQSTYIPIGATHRLENPGKIPLELIEVQSGSYLGEDDIVRFEDIYGRNGC